MFGLFGIEVIWVGKMIRLHTINDLHERQHSLGLYCIHCDRWGEANLDWLIRTGRGQRVVTETRFRCRDCGKAVEKQVRPPVPAVSNAVAYI